MFGLDEDALREIKKILEKNINIEKCVIFGSRAVGEYKKNSDIDIALFGKLSFADISSIKGEFDESSIIYKIDLVHYESLKSEKLKENIMKFGIEIQVF